MHQKNCTTCNIAGCHERTNHTVDFISDIRKQNIIEEFICKHGCASHSEITKEPNGFCTLMGRNCHWWDGSDCSYKTSEQGESDCVEWQKEHDTRIRKEEREKVLGELRKKILQHAMEGVPSDNILGQHLQLGESHAYNSVLKDIEELREAQP